MGCPSSSQLSVSPSKVDWVRSALTSRKPLLLIDSKDKPILISALAAECEVLLTLDKGDFGLLLETTVYGMWVNTPHDFLMGEGLGWISSPLDG